VKKILALENVVSKYLCFLGRRLMMKKLLVLLLVLGMASMASAALQISVNGELEPIDSQIYLEPSQTIELDIWSTVPLLGGDPGENAYWVLTVDTTLGSISGGAPAISDPAWSFDGPYPGAGSDISGLPQGQDGIYASMATFGIAIPADVAIFDGIIFHCEYESGPTTITLWNAGGGGVIEGEPWDTVTIHQIPEPMTVGLLGLGGLFLLRRRK
jgi:hypothetical protein